MILGLNGYAGSGKDAAAAALVEHGFARVAFADVLRNMLYATDPHIPLVTTETELNRVWESNREVERLSFIVDDVGWDDAKNTYPDIRRLLQTLGTEGGREILGENIWVNTALGDTKPGDNIVITDVRFSNEANAIRERGGMVVKIVREGVGPVNNHISDNAMEFYDFDYIINNNGTLEDLHQEILMIAGFGEAA